MEENTNPVPDDKQLVAIETQRVLDKIRQENIVSVIPVAQIGEMMKNIHQLMKDHLIEDVHYGKLPGTDKVMLYKAGAEVVGMFFQLRPVYDIKTNYFDNLKIKFAEMHREYDVTCKLLKYSGMDQYVEVTEGQGSCSTLESKYRFRNQDAVDTGNPPPRNYWETYKQDKAAAKKLLKPNEIVKKNFSGSYSIHRLAGEKIENENIPDLYNTVKKMACKRAYVMAIQQFTASSNIFQVPDDDPDADGKEDQIVKPIPKDDIPDAKFVDITGNPTPQELNDPSWFIKQIEKISTEEEYGIFFSNYKTELSCFGGKDDELIRKVSLDKKKELYNKKINKEFEPK